MNQGNSNWVEYATCTRCGQEDLHLEICSECGHCEDCCACGDVDNDERE